MAKDIKYFFVFVIRCPTPTIRNIFVEKVAFAICEVNSFDINEAYCTNLYIMSFFLFYNCTVVRLDAFDIMIILILKTNFLSETFA